MRFPYISWDHLHVTTASTTMPHSSVNKVAQLSPTECSDNLTPITEPIQSGQAKAAKLVSLSQKLGWGGLAALVVGTILAGVTVGASAAAVVAACSGVSILAGAIVGQVGRGMQGRVI